VSTRKDRWKKLAKSKKYREEFVAAQVKRGIPFQVRRLLKQKELSQQELATRAKIAQGVVSRAADPEYGNLTLNTIIRIAAGFDIAFLGKFVSFSELDQWFDNLSEEPPIKTFDEENLEINAMEVCSQDSDNNGLEDTAPRQGAEIIPFESIPQRVRSFQQPPEQVRKQPGTQDELLELAIGAGGLQ
jgi:transcriptional regulator with XRE-family HTH domain